jgi:hypothetical protein
MVSPRLGQAAAADTKKKPSTQSDAGSKVNAAEIEHRNMLTGKL